MITFPSNPTIGQLYEIGGRSFRFNGTGWVVAAIPGGVVTQTTGQSIVDVMSQKAITDALAAVGDISARVERGITIDGSSVAVVRDYYSAQANITEITGRGITLVERSADNITFVTATTPFNVTGDIYWRITPNVENSFVKIKGQLV